MMTMGVKEVLKHMEQDEIEIRTLQRQVEILKGYLAEVVGPLDPECPEETLNTIPREGEGTRINPFLRACQEWWDNLEHKGVTIITGSLKFLHAMQEDVNKVVEILRQDFSIMDEVQAWSKDLQTLQAIKGQRYHILIDVYTREYLDMIDDWIEKIANGNKVMETLHEEIHRLKDQARE